MHVRLFGVELLAHGQLPVHVLLLASIRRDVRVLGIRITAGEKHEPWPEEKSSHNPATITPFLAIGNPGRFIETVRGRRCRARDSVPSAEAPKRRASQGTSGALPTTRPESRDRA